MARTNNRKLKRKVRNSYIISTISVALVLFLLGSVGYLILNAVKAADAMKENMAMHVMLDDLTVEQRREIRARLEGMEEVKEVTYVPKEEAAKDFKEYLQSDFEEFLSFNPLPDSYEIRLRAEFSEPDHIKKVDKTIGSWEGVNEVVYQRNVVEQITSNINTFNLVLLLFGGALLVISLILLNNTIRISIFSKRYLINTMKMVGASRWFIIKPFLKDSILQGLWAWLIAAVMFVAVVGGLSDGLPEVTSLADWRPVVIILGLMLLLSEVISVLFTTFAVNKFVNMNTSKIFLY